MSLRAVRGQTAPFCFRVFEQKNPIRPRILTTDFASRQLPEREESNERKMKHVNDTQWVNTPTRERLAATRKRTLRRVTARGARSVWSECQSRVIESRNSADRLGLPVCERGGSIALHTVRRHRSVAQAMCRGTGPGAESGAKAQWGVLGSWESRTVPAWNSRKRMTPAQQRPGAWAVLSQAQVSETRGSMRKPAREGNRSERVCGSGSRRGLIVATESRRTEAGRSL